MTDYFITEEFIGQEQQQKNGLKNLFKGTGVVSRH